MNEILKRGKLFLLSFLRVNKRVYSNRRGAHIAGFSAVNFADYVLVMMTAWLSKYTRI